MGKGLEAAAAAPARVAPRHARRRVRTWEPRLGALSARLEHEAFLIVLFAIYLVGVTRFMPGEIASDTWMTLLYGREVAHHGLPHHDALTIWAHGRTWVDQQWLGQLLFYWIHAVGGLRLLLFVHTVLLLLGFALALAFGRRTGGSSRSVALVGIVALFVALPNSAAR